MKFFRCLSILLSMLAPALAQAEEHMPQPWQLGFQDAASPIMERLSPLHDWLTILAAVISVFVLILLAILFIRFREKANPRPSKTTHNTPLEIIWTVVPILILVGIAIPSIKLHYYMSEPQEPEMTLKVVGYQWYWNYQYPDNGDFSFDSYMVEEKNLKEGEPRLLKTDNPVVVPVDTTILVQMTGGDVLHAWAMPAMGVKRDAVPGRLNESWFRATKTGTFYGQCSELCGIKHGFMPIELKVVSKEEFAVWTAAAKEEFARTGTVTPQALLAEAGHQAESVKQK